MEGFGWNGGDNCWRKSNVPSQFTTTALNQAIEWIQAAKAAFPNALVAKYLAPPGVSNDGFYSPLSTGLSQQGPLLDQIDIMAPEVYPWFNQQGADFSSGLSTFQSKLETVREARPAQLLCPIFFPTFFITGAIHDRASAGASCPVDSNGNHEWAPYATFDRVGSPICNYTALSNSQVQQFLDMFFKIGCDEMFFYSDAGREHVAYWTTAIGRVSGRC